LSNTTTFILKVTVPKTVNQSTVILLNVWHKHYYIFVDRIVHHVSHLCYFLLVNMKHSLNISTGMGLLT